MIIKETKDRKVLVEGRNQGMGFAMLKKVSPKYFETVNPISPCKDYLAEVIFTENTGIATEGCGLKYPKKEDIFGPNYSYLVFMNQKTKANTFNVEGKTFEEYSKEINTRYKNIQKFINAFQKDFGFKPCLITKANEDMFLVKFDTKWTVSTYSISLFTLLLRIGKDYNNEPIIDFINNIPQKSIDFNLIKETKTNIFKVFEAKKLPSILKKEIENAKKYNLPWSPHHNGIRAWSGIFE